jgi:hypothetical protein
MAYSEDQILALKNAIAQGALRVKYGDKEVEYRSLAEMKEILTMMENQNKPVANRRKYASFTKGTQ